MNYIRKMLNENCISQNKFSKITGLNRSGLNQMLQGKHKPTLETIKIISMGLERLDQTPWKEHAANIKMELNEGITLRIVGEE